MSVCAVFISSFETKINLHFYSVCFVTALRSIKEQECEIAQLKAENDMIRKQALPHRLGPKNVPIPLVPAKLGTIRCNSVGGAPSMDGAYTQDENQTVGIGSNVASSAASPMISSVAKVVQPTATVSSVPVSGPSKCRMTIHHPFNHVI